MAEYQKKLYTIDTFRAESCGKGHAFAGGGRFAAKSLCCDFADGVLYTGVGLRGYTFDGDEVLADERLQNADFFFFVEGEDEQQQPTLKLFCVSLEGKMYTYYEKNWVFTFDFKSRVRVAWALNKDRKKQYYFASKNGVHRLNGFIGFQTSIKTATADLCYYKDRLFCAVEPHSLAYSAPLFPNDFTESIDDGGKIALPKRKGNIVALLPMKNALYLFYEYGIFVLEGAGSPRDFVVREIGYGGGRIFADSVGTCAVGGEKAFFLAENGVYVFDGNKAEKTCQNLPIKPVCEGQVCVHAEFDGKYYVSFLSQDNVRKAVCVDGESGLGYFTFEAFGASVDEGIAFCVADGAVKTFCSNGGSLPLGKAYSYNLSNADFDCEERKVVKKLVLHGGGNVRVRLSGEKKSKEQLFDLTNGRAEATFGVRGKLFDFTITLQEGAYLRAVEVEYLTLSGNAKRRFAL